MEMPETRWAKSGELHIAYQVFGGGPINLVYVGGFATHVELTWDEPESRELFGRLAQYCRVVIFDKRGTGLSDRISGVATLEDRMDDVRAVMDASGMDRAVLYGVSEGGPMAILFAATFPTRVTALVLKGSFARFCEAPDYPWAQSRDGWLKSIALIEQFWGTGEVFARFDPASADDPSVLKRLARIERNSATPGTAAQLVRMNLDIDVRSVLPAIHVPTLVVHADGDPIIPEEHGAYLASHIEGARYLELAGNDHASNVADAPGWHDDVEEFLTGVRRGPQVGRVLATILFTDIVGSTERASRMGDSQWKDLLAQHHTIVRRHLDRFGGNEVVTLGDGFLATFDGPARAVQCAHEIGRALRSIDLEIRAGVHTGEIERSGDDVAGIAVHIGARVAALARANEILATRTVRDLTVGSGLHYDDRGDCALKGVEERWHLYAVTWDEPQHVPLNETD